ncbi:MAG: hypothetical protein QF879_18260, partial [Candidatus Latescibacteria bacterium]|nr:hypothetical protein [Candidatus Latescibacterota bacterium]
MSIDPSPTQPLASASQWRLMWMRFLRHRLAVVSAVVLILFYLVTLLGEVVAPYGANERNTRYIHGPPQNLHFFDGDGGFHLRPFVFGYTLTIDDDTWRRMYEDDTSKMYPIAFLVHGPEYRFWGLFKWDVHLFGENAEAIRREHGKNIIDSRFAVDGRLRLLPRRSPTPDDPVP